jgi:hypothetical protein
MNRFAVAGTALNMLVAAGTAQARAEPQQDPCIHQAKVTDTLRETVESLHSLLEKNAAIGPRRGHKEGNTVHALQEAFDSVADAYGKETSHSARMGCPQR